MDNFYIALITCSSIIVALVSSFLIFHINVIKNKKDELTRIYINDCLLLTRFLQLCHALKNEATYSIKECKINEEARECLALYEAIDSLVLILGKDAFEKYPQKEYTKQWLDENTNQINLIWYFLIHKQNKINAYKSRNFTPCGFSDEFTKEVLSHLSFGNRYTELNYETVGNIAGDVECTLIPRMRKTLNTINESGKNNEFKCILTAILSLIIIDCIVPIIFILLNTNNVWIGALLVLILLLLFAIICCKLYCWYRNLFTTYK